MTFEDLVGLSSMGIGLILAAEEHLFDYLQSVFIVSFFDE